MTITWAWKKQGLMSSLSYMTLSGHTADIQLTRGDATHGAAHTDAPSDDKTASQLQLLSITCLMEKSPTSSLLI